MVVGSGRSSAHHGSSASNFCPSLTDRTTHKEPASYLACLHGFFQLVSLPQRRLTASNSFGDAIAPIKCAVGTKCSPKIKRAARSSPRAEASRHRIKNRARGDLNKTRA